MTDLAKWRARIAKALPPDRNGKQAEALDRILWVLQYASKTETDLPPYLKKMERTRAVARQFQAALKKAAGEMQEKQPINLGINPNGANKSNVPWVDLYEILHHSTEALARWSARHAPRNGARKETIPWIRTQLQFCYAYCGGRRGWSKLFKAVDAAEYLRVGLNESTLPKIAPPKRKSKKHPR